MGVSVVSERINMLLDLLRFSLTNMLRARVRLLVTASGVVIGTCAVILLVALTIGLQASAEAGLGSNQTLTAITVYPNYQTVGITDDVPPITLETIEAFRQLEGVTAVVPMLPLEQQAELRVGRYSNSLAVYGVDVALLPLLGLDAISGDLATLQENDMVVGVDVASSFSDPRAESWIPVTVDLLNERVRLQVNNLSFTAQQSTDVNPAVVVESDDFEYNEAIYLPLQQVIDLNAWITGADLTADLITFEEVLVRSTGREATLQVVDTITAMGYATSSLGDFLAEINNFFNLMRLVLGGVGVVALLIAAFGVANTMMMAIIERTSEIGLMKAIGARDSDVLLVFLLEAGIVGLVGGIIGVFVSLFLRDWINESLASVSGDNQLALLLDSAQLQGDLVIVPPELLVIAVILATIVGLGAGLFPAWRAAHLSPVIALKQE